MGWFRGFVIPMLGVGFLFAIFWFWFIERMGSVAKPQDLYMPAPQELAALRQAALEKQEKQRASVLPNSAPLADTASKPEVVAPKLPNALVPSGRAVFNLGQEAPKLQPKPAQAPTKPPQV